MKRDDMDDLGCQHPRLTPIDTYPSQLLSTEIRISTSIYIYSCLMHDSDMGIQQARRLSIFVEGHSILCISFSIEILLLGLLVCRGCMDRCPKKGLISPLKGREWITWDTVTKTLVAKEDGLIPISLTIFRQAALCVCYYI